MLDHHGGFYILRDDVDVATIALEIVRDYLEDTGHSTDTFELLWYGREDLGALLLIVAAAGRKPDEDSARWLSQNLALGSRLARALAAPVWGYRYDNRIGREDVSIFDAGGSLESESTAQWDDGGRLALDELAAALSAPRVLIEYDLPFSNAPLRTSADGKQDRDAFAAWLDGLPAIVWPGSGTEVTLFLQATAATELTRTANALGVQRGELVDALWESTKAVVYASIPSIENDHINGPEAYMKAPPARDTALVLGTPDGALPPLDPLENKVAVRLGLSDGTIREMQELALSADRSQSYVLQKTCAVGRARMLAAVDVD